MLITSCLHQDVVERYETIIGSFSFSNRIEFLVAEYFPSQIELEFYGFLVGRIFDD